MRHAGNSNEDVWSGVRKVTRSVEDTKTTNSRKKESGSEEKKLIRAQREQEIQLLRKLHNPK